MRGRMLGVLLTLFGLSACMGADNPVPLTTIEALTGTWQQVDGNASVRFYADESVKLTMPDEQPPLRVLSVIETIKDEQIGFSIGDRWSGPVHVRHSKDWQMLTLVFPGDKNDAREVTFRRQKPDPHPRKDGG